MSSAPSRRRAQGVARYSLLILVLLIAVAGGAIYWQIKHGQEADQPSQDVVAAAGPVLRAGIGTDELLQHAREAMAAQRLLAPAGNNAFELYLAVLEREPGNRVAQDALREIFPFAAHAAEQTIDSGDAAEAQRQIDLLTRADPQNYTLTLLQAKLQARYTADAPQVQQTPQASRRESAPLPMAKAASVMPAVSPVASSPVASTPTPTSVPVARPGNALTPAEQAIARLQVESTPVEAAPTSAMRARTPRPAAAVADANGNRAPVLSHRVEPAYPPDAKRTRRQGWVDVSFTVEADGSVIGATVTDADPKYVFDRAALSAVSRWQFTPGMQDGKPVASSMRQRIEFRL